MKHKRILRRRYKRLAAAVAGAAIISLPVMPAVQAADNPNAAQPSISYQTESPANQPSAPSQEAGQTGDPVRVVTANADNYGFDPANGTFSLLTQNGAKAVVRVRSNGQTYKVDLDKQGDIWTISTVRAIGDIARPAKFKPARLLARLARGNIADAPLILYQTNNYNSWMWNEASYPQDSAFGVLLKAPSPNETSIPAAPQALNPLNGVDFSRQLVVFAHLGTTAEHGYGVGIARVVQSNNDLTVTVRLQSPPSNTTPVPTKTDDFVPIERTGINQNAPLNVLFVDQAGTVLNRYTINPA